MRRFEYASFESRELHTRVVAALSMERGGKADALGLLGEILARRTFVPEGFADPRNYCVRALGMSQDQAFRRLRAARTVHTFPALLPAVADGRLGVTAINTLAPQLTEENCAELIALAAGKTISELERALRARVTPVLERVAESSPHFAPEPEVATEPLAPAPVGPMAEQQVEEPVFAAPEPVGRRVALGAAVLEKLERAKALLAHVTRSETEVLERALDTLIAKLEARKFAKTDRPRAPRGSDDPRQVPAHVMRAVSERDGGRCTFMGDHGHRCDATAGLEYDHIVPVARGGQSTVDNLRLRCRAHNQLEAERTFGADFVRRKREEKRLALAPAPEQVAKRNDLIAGLRTLGYTGTQAREAAAKCADKLDLSLEALLKHALTYLMPASVRREGVTSSA